MAGVSHGETELCLRLLPDAPGQVGKVRAYGPYSCPAGAPLQDPL
jgi:hypothetical protein